MENNEYGSEWTSAYSPVEYESYSPSEEEQPKRKKKKKTEGIPLVLIIQLVLCGLAVLAAYCIKQIGGDFYRELRSGYYESMGSQIILDYDFSKFSLDSLLNAPEN